jgi:hypothetical protein
MPIWSGRNSWRGGVIQITTPACAWRNRANHEEKNLSQKSRNPKLNLSNEWKVLAGCRLARAATACPCWRGHYDCPVTATMWSILAPRISISVNEKNRLSCCCYQTNTMYRYPMHCHQRDIFPALQGLHQSCWQAINTTLMASTYLHNTEHSLTDVQN